MNYITTTHFAVIKMNVFQRCTVITFTLKQIIYIYRKHIILGDSVTTK